MWRKAILSLPANLAAVNCALLSVHPWVYGVGRHEESGQYLSPQNAVDYLAGKLAGAGGAQQVVAFMICAADHAGFMQALRQFSQVLPLPTIAQVSRMAATAATLATTKMQLPAAGGAGLPLPQPLSTASTRLMMNAQRITAAKQAASAGVTVEGVQSALAGFSAAKAKALAKMESTLTDVLAATTPAWVFTGRNHPATLAREIKKDVPQSDAVFTLATLFVGEDLTPLEAMIHDTDNHVGPGW